MKLQCALVMMLLVSAASEARVYISPGVSPRLRVGAELMSEPTFVSMSAYQNTQDSARVLKRRGVTVAGKNGEVLTIFQSENGTSQSQCHIFRGTAKELAMDEHEFNYKAGGSSGPLPHHDTNEDVLSKLDEDAGAGQSGSPITIGDKGYNKDNTKIETTNKFRKNIIRKPSAEFCVVESENDFRRTCKRPAESRLEEVKCDMASDVIKTSYIEEARLLNCKEKDPKSGVLGLRYYPLGMYLKQELMRIYRPLRPTPSQQIFLDYMNNELKLFPEEETEKSLMARLPLCRPKNSVRTIPFPTMSEPARMIQHESLR